MRPPAPPRRTNRRCAEARRFWPPAAARNPNWPQKKDWQSTISQDSEGNGHITELLQMAPDPGAEGLTEPFARDRARRGPSGAVKRADERPPPRGSRTPYLRQ